MSRARAWDSPLVVHHPEKAGEFLRGEAALQPETSPAIVDSIQQALPVSDQTIDEQAASAQDSAAHQATRRKIALKRQRHLRNTERMLIDQHGTDVFLELERLERELVASDPKIKRQLTYIGYEAMGLTEKGRTTNYYDK